jgi:methionyl-tRNA synthetase
MLLAADYTDENGKACVEPLTAPWAAPGTPVVLEGTDPAALKEKEISADVFFQVEITVNDRQVLIAGKKLVADGKPLTTTYTVNSGVN